MSKRLIALCMALAVFAVAPTLASARPVITDPTGTVLNPSGQECTGVIGACIRAHNLGAITFVTSSGTLTCSTGTLTGVLKKNNTAEGIEWEVTSATFAGTGPIVNGEGECTSSQPIFVPNTTITPNPATNGLPWCFAATAASDEGTVKGGSCGSSRPIRFTLDITSIGTCTYERASLVSMTIDTDVSPTNPDALITVTNQSWPLLEGPGLCPSSFALNMTFTLETDKTAGTEQVWFSS